MRQRRALLAVAGDRMSIRMTAHAELLPPPEAAPLPRRLLRASRSYLPAMLRNLHLRFVLANLVCRLFPDFASGVLRSRLYRLAGLDVDVKASIMGNLTLVSGLPGFYDKLHIGPG